MSQSDAPRTTLGGQLASTPPAQVLKVLEGKKSTARVSFDTEIGHGEVNLVEGKIVDAMLGDLFGRQALLSLLGAAEGHFSVADLAKAEPRPPLCPSIDLLLSERAKRIADWRRLSEQMPPLSSSLKLSPEGVETLPKKDLKPEEKRLVPLLDGRRSIADLVNDSELDAVDAFGILVGWLRSGLILELPGPEHRQPEPFQPARPTPRPHPAGAGAMSQPPSAAAPVPAAKPAAGAGPAPGAAPTVPMAEPVEPISSRRGRGGRRTTVIGMGIPAPEPVQPRRAEVHRTISVGSPSAPPPVEPGRIRTISAMPAPPVASAYSPAGPRLSPAAAAAAERSAVERARAGGRRAIGRYEILARIGHGGMGSVYLCRMTSETGFRRLFALKLLRQHLLDDPTAATRFLEEARLAGLLHHPNVVSVLDAGIDGAQPFLVMDYVEGASLKQLLYAHPIARPAELIVPIVLDALAGLHAAHNLVDDDGAPLNLVHCNVSPENLLVGVNGVCRLVDFGVARRESTGGDRIAHGKPAYLAPEQVLRRGVDRRVNIFGMGIVLYNTLTGTRLFDAANVDETMNNVVHQPIPPPSTIGLGPPPCFDFICMKALERDPGRRYTSAEDMASELRRVALRENLVAPPNAIAAWVRTCVGRELDQRRLSILDASRNRGAPDAGPAPRASVPPLADGSTVVLRSIQPPQVGVPSELPSEPPPDGETTGTMPLDLGARARRWALIAAAAIAASAVLITLLWPGRVSRFFRLNTSSVRSDGIDISIDSAAVDTGSEAPSPSASALLPSGDTPPEPAPSAGSATSQGSDTSEGSE